MVSVMHPKEWGQGMATDNTFVDGASKFRIETVKKLNLLMVNGLYLFTAFLV